MRQRLQVALDPAPGDDHAGHLGALEDHGRGVVHVQVRQDARPVGHRHRQPGQQRSPTGRRLQVDATRGRGLQKGERREGETSAPSQKALPPCNSHCTKV